MFIERIPDFLKELSEQLLGREVIPGLEADDRDVRLAVIVFSGKLIFDEVYNRSLASAPRPVQTNDKRLRASCGFQNISQPLSERGPSDKISLTILDWRIGGKR